MLLIHNIVCNNIHNNKGTKMSRFLVKRNNKYKLFCDTLDQWVSPLLGKDKMIEYMYSEWANGKEFNEEEAQRSVVLAGLDTHDEFRNWEYCDTEHKRQTRK